MLLPLEKKKEQRGTASEFTAVKETEYYFRETLPLVYADLPIVLVHVAGPPVTHVEALGPRTDRGVKLVR